MLGRAATLEDVGNAAVFAVSEWGRSLTATKLNITCGTIPDELRRCIPLLRDRGPRFA